MFDSEWEERDGAFRKKAPFEQRDTKGKTIIKAYVCNKCFV